MLNNPKVAIVGAGKLSWNLIPALQQAGAEVVQLISRTQEKRERFCKAFGIHPILCVWGLTF